jgi:ribonuclease HI
MLFWKKIPTHFQYYGTAEESKTAGKHVKILWIPAHTGITGTEKADELARQRSTSGTGEIVKSLFHLRA